MPPDTIVALASPPGRGAVAVLRISGRRVPEVAFALLGLLPAPRLACLRPFRDHDGSALDQGIALYFPAPASFTGEDVLELQGHGGACVVDRLMQRVLALGCRVARPGEFTERAFLNGKMDLAQAEAVADLIDAGTASAARAAVRSLQGEFSERIHALSMQLTALRVFVEAGIDFPDEEVEGLSDPARRARLAQIFADFESIMAAARQGALLREGLSIVIAGKPNAGKSSLLNRLVGDDVAIVSTSPGTTRDVLRHHVQLDGLPVTLIDTAGLRAAGDAVEEEGIRRARLEMQRADRILYVVDASSPEGLGTGLPADLPDGVPVTLVFNKIDLLGTEACLQQIAGQSRVFLSMRTGEGLTLLREHLKAAAGYVSAEGGVFSARRRHLDALRRAHALATEAAATLRAAGAPELFAEDLRLAQSALGEITGEVSSDDLLGEIFSSFCIGK